MSDPSDWVAQANLGCLLVKDRWWLDDWLADARTLLNTCPTMYLKIVFLYFGKYFVAEFGTTRNGCSKPLVGSFLAEFDFLPEQFKGDLITGEFARVMWTRFTSGFKQYYPLYPKIDFEVKFPFSYGNYLTGLPYSRLETYPDYGITSSGQMFDLLRRNYEAYKERYQSNSKPLLTKLQVFQCMVSFGTTLYATYRTALLDLQSAQQTRCIQDVHDFLCRFVARMDTEPVERQVYIREVFNILYENAQVAQLCKFELNPRGYTGRVLDYLVRERFLRSNWLNTIGFNVEVLKRHSSERFISNQSVCLYWETSQQELDYLVMSSILPDPTELNNGHLLDLVTDSAVKWAVKGHVYSRREAELNCQLMRTRNSIIWKVIVQARVMSLVGNPNWAIRPKEWHLADSMTDDDELKKKKNMSSVGPIDLIHNPPNKDRYYSHGIGPADKLGPGFPSWDK